MAALLAAVLLAFGSLAAERSGAGPAAPSEAIAESDRLFSEGESLERAQAALRLLEIALVGAPRDYELLWRTARARFQVAAGLAAEDRVATLERAIAAGEAAVRAEPGRAEGYYWLGASEGRRAEEKGGLKALMAAKRIRRDMEAVVRIQPDYEMGDAFLALGLLDRRLPGLFGGDGKRGLGYLQEGVRRTPLNMELRLALAEALVEEGRGAEARQQIQEILARPVDPARQRAESEARESARRLLERLR